MFGRISSYPHALCNTIYYCMDCSFLYYIDYIFYVGIQAKKTNMRRHNSYAYIIIYRFVCTAIYAYHGDDCFVEKTQVLPFLKNLQLCRISAEPLCRTGFVTPSGTFVLQAKL